MLSELLLSLLLALKPIAISINPRVGTARLDVLVTITTLPDPDNEVTCVVWDGGDAGSSCWEMLGDREPIQKKFWIKSLSPGEYTIEVRLHRHTGQDFTDRAQLEVN